MKKCDKIYVQKERWTRIFLLMILLFALIPGSTFEQQKTIHGSVTSKRKILTSNTVEMYRVPWWGTQGSIRGRPIYKVINIENGQLSLRHALLEGTMLGDYRLPYWPIRGFISIFSKSAELSHQSKVIFTIADKTDTIPFRIGEQRTKDITSESDMEVFELAHVQDADILKITNRGNVSTLIIENFFVVHNGSQDIPIFIRATNTSNQTIHNVVVQVTYEQDFNWSSFGASDSKKYITLKAPATGNAKKFFAFSSGMERGFEFQKIEGCNLSYTISSKLNAWEVIIHNTATELAPGASMVFQYDLRVIDKPPQRTSENKVMSKQVLDGILFTKIKPTVVKNAPINPEKRTTIHEVIQNLEKPKVRGLNLRTDFAHAFDDLSILKEWGGNLIITSIRNPEESKQIIEYGHELGMEMLIPGEGGSTLRGSSIPKFDRLFATNPKPNEYPESYGQDEDHYYWFGAKPTINFETNFSKMMNVATQQEKVIYWSQCFVDKWRNVLSDVRRQDPEGNIWFYTPSPSVANIDPLDYYDLFIHEVAKLGDALTVFPFYYGVAYDQVEYMMYRWKNAGVHRVVFLPMSDFMTRPSQFVRAITAARRGGSDGTCGFAFMVGREVSGREWQWKSVMLASQANFPTPELNAYCFIEEPAELVEELAISDLYIYSSKSDTIDFLNKLEKMLPGHVQWINGQPEKQPQHGQIYVVVGDNLFLDQDKWIYDLQKQNPGTQKGVIQMSGNVVRLNGTDMAGLKNAEKLFLRFAELAMAERNQ